ncbi:MAG: VWA domain-containing protein [Myxococcales bacterium]|nr:VWA domain-containing protein [Myxococcales bacterium]
MTFASPARVLSLGLLGLAFSLTTGCSSALTENAEGSGTGEDESSAGSATAASSDGGTSGGSSDSGSASDSGEGTGGASGDGDSAGDSAGDSGGDTDGGEPIDPGQLTAGEWRDLDHWDFWLDLMGKVEWAKFQDTWRFFTTQRYAVVVESGGVQVNDAEVVLLAGQDPLWEARTDIRGRAELFAGMFGPPVDGPYTLSVNGAVIAEDVQPAAADPIILQIDAVEAPAQVLDLLFMIDTTGSMGDELNYLQAELADVIDEIRTLAGQDLKLRLSVNFYRDHGDDYLVREFPFTEDIDQALADLAAQNAGGGGDFPEAVTEGLDSAIAGHQWSDSAVSRIAFLVLDAPPHDDVADNIGTMNIRVQEAAAKGIRIVPVASSGVDKSTEFFLRFIDIATGGTYVFLTSDSGIGGAHIAPTIGEYQVEYLNDLLVRLISESVGAA